MRGSKALKPKKFRWQYEYDEEKNFFHIENLTYLFKEYIWWPVSDNYRAFRERSKRALEFAKFGWYNFDWDMAYTWDLFEFKLKRLRNALEHGHAVQEPEDMAALKELIKIVRRLRDYDRYSSKYLRQHDAKWGKTEHRTEPWVGENGKYRGSTWISWRKNCPENAPEELKEQERKECLDCHKKGEEDWFRDIDRMAEILKKHSRSFWD